MLSAGHITSCLQRTHEVVGQGGDGGGEQFQRSSLLLLKCTPERWRSSQSCQSSSIHDPENRFNRIFYSNFFKTFCQKEKGKRKRKVLIALLSFRCFSGQTLNEFDELSCPTTSPHPWVGTDQYCRVQFTIWRN